MRRSILITARLSWLPNHRPTSCSVFTSSFLDRKHDLVANEKEEESYSRLKKFHKSKERTREDRYWSMREKSSAYQGNPGVNRSLKKIRDANEVNAPTMDRLDTDVREYGLDLLESTNQYQHILEMDDDGKTRYRGNPTPGHVIHMHKTRRKYFTHIEPMLLTWIEREVMKRLHKTSPQEWTAEKLSDCFPATPEVCSRIIRSNYSRATQQKIKQIDDEVRENWKKLVKGQLDGISEGYLSHLQAGGPKLVEGPAMSSGAFHELTQTILVEHEKSLAPAKPTVKGPIGKIYADYKSKLQSIQGPPSVQLQDPDSEGKIIVDVKPGQLMSSEDDLLDLTCGRRATGGTALLNVQGIDSKLRKAGNITLDTFRKKYLFSNAEKEAKKGNPLSKAYLNWLKKVRQEDSQLGAGASNLLSLAEESHELLADNEESSFRVIPKYKLSLDKDSQQEDRVDMQSSVIDEELESLTSQSKESLVERSLSAEERQKYANKAGVIQKGDCFYDTHGNFLHRVPGLVKYNRKSFKL